MSNYKNVNIYFEPHLDAYLISGFDNNNNFFLKKYANEEKIKILTKSKLQKPSLIEGALSTPLKIQIQVTKACNFKCGFCYDSRSLLDRAELTFSEVKNILSYCRTWGISQVEWTGGDPFMKKDFIEMLQMANDMGFAQNILTNGVILGKLSKEKRMIVSKTVSRIQVSLDGVGDTFNKNTGGNYWNYFDDALKIITQDDIRINVACVITKEVVSDIEKIINFCDKSSINNLRFGLIVQNKHYDGDYIQVVKEFKKAYEKYAINNKPKTKVFVPWTRQGASNRDEIIDIPYEWTISPGGRTIFYIDSYGDIYPFPYLNTNEFNLGNIKNDDIVDVWKNHKILKDLRSLNLENTGCTSCNGICGLWDRSFMYYHSNGNLMASSRDAFSCVDFFD